MAAVFPNEGEEAIGDDITGANLTLALFRNDYTPVAGSQLANFTVATFTGYAAKTLTGGAWTSTQGAPTTVVYAEQTFTSSADQSVQQIYGYFIHNGTQVLWAERFSDAPYAMQYNGDRILITPSLSVGS
jgi:hypothetical protein